MPFHLFIIQEAIESVILRRERWHSFSVLYLVWVHSNEFGQLLENVVILLAVVT